MDKTAGGLVAYAEAQLGKPYWYGTFGNTASEALYQQQKRRYPSYYTASDFASQYGQRVHDCVGLIKGYRWSDSPTAPPRYNASQDVSVSGLYAQCGQTGGIGTLPEEAGVCVFMSDMSHVGVYVGGGYVIEARGHAYGVVRTGLSARGWGRWGKPNWIAYASSGNGTSTKGDYILEMKLLRTGSRGEAVRALQILLNGRGFDSGEADGVFGAKTAAAVRAYQAAATLAVDGVVGEKTMSALLGL